jgi:hypothetical protein
MHHFNPKTLPLKGFRRKNKGVSTLIRSIGFPETLCCKGFQEYFAETLALCEFQRNIVKFRY